MKNIHVLPTDKPSKLFYNVGGTLLYTSYGNHNGVNIYITNDEEDINENDYIITKDGRLVQVSYLLSKDVYSASKVILATDQDLNKDGVQAIDDEFLDWYWFARNPSCEYVDVKDITTIPALQLGSPNGHLMYKIIIPREEPSFQDSIENSLNIISIASSMFGKKEEPKQETLKEFTEQDMINFLDFCKSTNREKSFYEMKCLLNRENIESKELLQIWKEQNLKNK